MRFKAHVLKLESVPTTYSGQSYSKVVSLAHRNLLHCHVENNEPFRRRIERMSYRNFILSWIRFLFTIKPIILDYVFVWLRREIHHTRRKEEFARVRAVHTQRLYNRYTYIRTYMYIVYVTVRRAETEQRAHVYVNVPADRCCARSQAFGKLCT